MVISRVILCIFIIILMNILSSLLIILSTFMAISVSFYIIFVPFLCHFSIILVSFCHFFLSFPPFSSLSPSNPLQLWDRRALSRGERYYPVGAFSGHVEGITYIDPKGDGRYFISNAKDHTIRLWDLRNMGSPTLQAQGGGSRYADYR